MDEPRHFGNLGRRRFLRVAGGAAVVGGASYVLVRGIAFEGDGDGERAGSAKGPGQDHALDEFAANVESGGPPKDGIPPIDEPRFVSAADAGFLEDDDVVFGIVRGGDARAYPQLVLVWHEIVNDRFDDGPLSVTYCPLTGSVVGFRGSSPEGEQYTFGTSGDLVNSNLLMYDRQTDGRWPQILGRAITGPRRGETLEEIPLEWTTWGRWRRAFPRTRVLSLETGHLRSYGTDPYGDYTPLGGYYRGGELFFPVMIEDERFPPKEVFVGAKHGAARVAVRKEVLREERLVDAEGDGEPLVFLYDPALDEGRAFIAPTGEERVQLAAGDRQGEYVDETSGSRFDAWGRSVAGSGAGAALARVSSYDVMWFAWTAFFPTTAVIG